MRVVAGNLKKELKISWEGLFNETSRQLIHNGEEIDAIAWILSAKSEK
jgi:hypothetical protein